MIVQVGSKEVTVEALEVDAGLVGRLEDSEWARAAAEPNTVALAEELVDFRARFEGSEAVRASGGEACRLARSQARRGHGQRVPGCIAQSQPLTR